MQPKLNENKKNSLIGMVARFLSNEPIQYKAMELVATWKTRDYHLEKRGWARQELEWREDDLTCYDIVDENLEILDNK